MVSGTSLPFDVACNVFVFPFSVYLSLRLNVGHNNSLNEELILLWMLNVLCTRWTLTIFSSVTMNEKSNMAGTLNGSNPLPPRNKHSYIFRPIPTRLEIFRLPHRPHQTQIRSMFLRASLCRWSDSCLQDFTITLFLWTENASQGKHNIRHKIYANSCKQF